MTKAQLQEHMTIVCDAENAIFACDEAIQSLENQIKSMRHTQKPEEPQRDTVYHIREAKPQASCIMQIVSAVLGLLIFHGIYSNFFSYSAGRNALVIMGSPLAGVFIYHWFLNSSYQSRVQKANRKRESDADTRYTKNMEKYRNDLVLYQHAVQTEKNIEKMLHDEIEKQKNTRERIRKKLQNVYEMNIVHTSFRDIIAVNQIREYLEMGVCDALEGSNGAYAQYLMDVRANRICQSIHDLKTSIVSTIHSLAMTQSMLIQEVRMTNSHIDSLTSSLNSGLQSLQNSYKTALENSTQQISSYLSQSNLQLNNMQKSISTAAYNQYVALREQNVQNYLLRQP